MFAKTLLLNEVRSNVGSLLGSVLEAANYGSVGYYRCMTLFVRLWLVALLKS